MEPCPSLDDLRAVLDCRLPADQQTALSRHLDECATCQQTLERLASGSRSWENVARQLAMPHLPSLRLRPSRTP